jgi:hypothetical protein
MPQLPRTYLERPLARSAGAASSPNLPGQPRIDTRDVQSSYAAAGAAGRALQRLSGLVQETAERMKQANDVGVRAHKLGQFLVAEGEEEEAIEASQDIPPLLRDENLKFRMEERIQGLLEDVEDDNLRLRLEGEMREQVAIRQREIRTQGRKDFVDKTTVGIAAVVSQLQSQYLKTQDSLARQQIRQTQSELLSQGEQVGVFAPGYAGVQMQKLDEESTLTQAQALVVAQPDLAEKHFQLLAEGKPGIEGLPVPAPHEVPKLLDQAQQEVSQQLTRAEAVRVAGERALDKAQAGNETKLSIQIENATTMGELDRLLRVVQSAGLDGTASGVSPDGLRRLQEDVRRRRKTLEEKVKDAKSDPRVLEPLEQRLYLGRGYRSYAETEMLRNQVVAEVDKGGLLWKDAKPIIAALNEELAGDGPLNNPVVQRERQGLVATMRARSQDDESSDRDEAGLQVLTLRLFDDTMHATFEQDLVGGARAVEKKAPEVRRELEDQYNEKSIGVLLKKLRDEPTQVPKDVLDESSLQEGSSRSEIDAAFGHAKAEVARRYAQGSLTSTQALAYKHQLDKRHAWWLRVAPPQAKPQGNRGRSSPRDQLGGQLGLERR